MGSTPTVSTIFSSNSERIEAFSDDHDKLWQYTVAVNKHPFKAARLVHHNYNMAKQWYVVYYAWDVSKDKLVRKRQAEPLNRLKNLQKRLSMADYMIRVLNGQMRDGKVLGKDTISHHAKHDLKSAKVLEAMKFFVEQKKLDNHRQNYLRRFHTLQSNWQLWLDDQHIKDFELKKIDTDDMYSFFLFLQEKRKVSNTTYNNYRNDFNIFINWVRKRFPNVIKKHPVEQVPILKTVTRKHAAFNDAQMKAIKEKCVEMHMDNLLLFINFVYYTLARPGELRQLRVEHIDLKENRLFIPGSISKNHNDEYVPIAPALRKVIESRKLVASPPQYYIFGMINQYKPRIKAKPGSMITGIKYFWKCNVEILKALSLNDRNYDLYSYKHSGAISLYKATKDIKLIQRQCRHRSLEQTNTYLRDLGMDDYQSLKGWKGAL